MVHERGPKLAIPRGKRQIDLTFRCAAHYWGKGKLLPPPADKSPKLAKSYKDYQNYLAEIRARVHPGNESPDDVAKRVKMDLDEAFRIVTGYSEELPPPPERGGPYQDYLEQLAQPVPLIFFTLIFSLNILIEFDVFH